MNCKHTQGATNLKSDELIPEWIGDGKVNVVLSQTLHLGISCKCEHVFTVQLDESVDSWFHGGRHVQTVNSLKWCVEGVGE